MYLYLCSDSCTDIFPDNNASDFRVKLPKTFFLRDQNCSWSIALIDVDLPKLVAGYKPRFITFESRTCASAIYKTDLRPVLQRLYHFQIRKGTPVIIDNPRYVQLNAKSLDVIDLYLLDDQGARVSFAPGPLCCTLHLLCTEN